MFKFAFKKPIFLFNKMKKQVKEAKKYFKD